MVVRLTNSCAWSRHSEFRSPAVTAAVPVHQPRATFATPRPASFAIQLGRKRRLLQTVHSFAPRRAEDIESEEEDAIAHYGEAGVGDLARQRGGWLFFFSFGLVFAAAIVHDFDALIAQHVELSFFVPLIMGHAGNSGSQTSSALVRALALKQVSPKSAPEVIVKEAFAGCMMGSALGLFILALTLSTHCFSTEVGLVVAIALPLVSLWANGLGAALTLTSAKLRLDPGLTSAPLVTTIVDTTGIMIYLSIAQAVISPGGFLTGVVADHAVMASLSQPPGM